ncbi:hypothetical protein [Streptomyces sp. NPDC046712]|uniref:hypothetical protein n=1 Tax=Streptomyces sp. NPDC046712 TaxID=3154802 RepID=UPI0033FF0893
MVAPVTVARAQGLFNLAGGLWPLLSLRTFERVYGPKTDDWLQKTSAGLLAVSGMSMLRTAATAEGVRAARRTGVGTAVTLLAVDVVYVPRGRISPAYLMDAAKEIAWLTAWFKAGRLSRNGYGTGGHGAEERGAGDRGVVGAGADDRGAGDRRAVGAGAEDRGAEGQVASHASDPRLLDVYLNDHLAGASSGAALMRRAARAHRGSPLGPQLEELAEEVRQDRASLRGTMSALGVRRRPSRAALGLVLERAGRLKLNGRVFSRSPLSDVVELEAMRLGVEGKEACWRSLRTLARTDPRLDPVRLDFLIHRARRQARALESMRASCVPHALTTR